MIKSVYEFIKIFSFLFLLSGIFFATQGMFVIAGINIVSFLLIKILDSDWAFNLFKFSNHNMFVTVITFILIFVNSYFIYQDMKYATLFNRVDKTTQESYLAYETSLYEAMKPCSDRHNAIINSLKNKQQITTSQIKDSHSTCYGVLNSIEEQKVPEKLPPEVKKLCLKNKNEIKNIAADLGDYDYAKRNNQQALNQRLQENINSAIKTLQKIRAILQLPKDNNKSQKSFIEL